MYIKQWRNTNYATCNKYATKQALQFVTPMMSYNAAFDNQIWL